MKSQQMKKLAVSVLAVAGLTMTSVSAWADKPDHAGGGKSHKEKEHHGKGKKGKDDDDQGSSKNRNSVSSSSSTSVTFSFGSADLRIAQDYYGAQAKKGKCPPGLAKKNNGCQPPGQAKQWNKGRPLGADVRYYDVPYELRVRLPSPPSGHKYVQVAGDILLLAVGTNMVVDALEGLF